MSAATHERRRGDVIEPAIPMVSLGITVNAFSVHLHQKSGLEAERRVFGVEGLALTSLFVGALSIVWILLR